MSLKEKRGDRGTEEGGIIHMLLHINQALLQLAIQRKDNLKN